MFLGVFFTTIKNRTNLNAHTRGIISYDIVSLNLAEQQEHLH